MTAERPSLPVITVDGPDVDPRDCIEPGTSGNVTLGWMVIVLGCLVFAASTMGVGLLLLLIAPVVDWFNQKRVRALIHGSGLKVSDKQFPEIHDCVEKFCERLGMPEVPDVYIVEASILNAFAVKFGKRDVILLTDDLVHASIIQQDPSSLAFVLGHELGHIALGHTGRIRTWLRSSLKKLSRLDEYSVDRIGLKLVGRKQIAVEGILLLTVGPHLLPYVNPVAVRDQVNEVAADKYSRKAEKQSTHPLLLHRIRSIMASQ
jgi:Zn-dependent protease with chaperone function